jgi:hypothetical protein
MFRLRLARGGKHSGGVASRAPVAASHDADAQLLRDLAASLELVQRRLEA